MPHVASESCPYWRTRGVSLPRRMSMRCPAPYRWRRSRASRTMVDMSFWAGTVPSHAAGGSRHVSQLPHGSLTSPK